MDGTGSNELRMNHLIPDLIKSFDRLFKIFQVDANTTASHL